MQLDRAKIQAAFPHMAWSYAEQLDCVKIGKWNGTEFVFPEPLDETYLLELRVFNEWRELKFTGDKCRDTADYNQCSAIQPLADTQYYMYGERAVAQGAYTALSEERGGILLFPAKLAFPATDTLPKGVVGLKLGIRNFIRYNPVPVLPVGENCDYMLSKSGAGALEAVDYAYTGFFYANGKAVEV